MVATSNVPVLRTTHLFKNLSLGGGVVHILSDVSFEIGRGERVGIIGPSGSGKSTLLGLMGGLDTPTSGTIEIDGVNISRMGEGQLTHIRNAKIGFVFQFFNLIPSLTALENVALPIEFAAHRQFNPRRRAKELLEQLGLGDRLYHRPAQLSGGQQQRVAIARALANNPPLLLADEPTGNLDAESGEIVLGAINLMQHTMGMTVVIVTHDPRIAGQMDRVLTLTNGQLTSGPNLADTLAAATVPIVQPA